MKAVSSRDWREWCQVRQGLLWAGAVSKQRVSGKGEKECIKATRLNFSIWGKTGAQEISHWQTV